MKRILAVMLVVAALVAAMAVPAFADAGGKGGNSDVVAFCKYYGGKPLGSCVSYFTR